MKTKKMIISFMLFILLMPTISSLLSLGNALTINENRTKEDFPDISALEGQGFNAINEWYNDNFGLRDVMIRLQHQIDYSVFRYSKNLYFSRVNKPQYLFYKSVIDSEQIANEFLTSERQDEIVNAFNNIRKRLEEQNIDFKFIIPPQKNEILSNEQGFFPVNRPIDNMYYVMQSRFKESELKSNYVNVIDTLIEKNNKIPTYYYSDFHWNDWGAACAFGEVINNYAFETGLGVVYNPDELQVSTFLPDKNFAQLASLSVLWYDIPVEYTVHKADSGIAKEISLEEYPEWLIWENPNAIFPESVLFIGDSYTPPALCTYNGTSSGIVDLFPRVYFCHWDYADGVLNNIPTDVGLVVIEAIESNYSYLDKKISAVLNM